MFTVSTNTTHLRSEEYADSDATLAEGEKQCEALLKSIKLWRRKCATHTQNPTPAAEPAAAAPDAVPATAAADTPAAEVVVAPKKAPDVRLDWFQTATTVTVCFFIKMGQQMSGSTDHASVDIKHNQLTVSIKLKDGSKYDWKANPLFGEVDVATSTTSVKHMKVELVLTKKHSGEQWDKLEGTPSVAQFKEKVSAYPTSNKKGINWATHSVEEEDDAPEGNDALNTLLKDIYGKGDPATQQAMNKSFTESNGTVLSTNWSEVGSKKVEGQAPKGMVEQKW